jgi:actin-related protein 8
MRVKIANNIVFAGGGTHLQDLVEEMEGRVLEKVADFDVAEIERVEVKAMIREIRPASLAWVGATVLPKTESMNDMWISRLRWIGELEVN